ncbi:MAG: chorismate synthase [Synergistaceae bacterium]|jgi:chorismate synthase|nr:chorismate synthase [Synergistaceae bacterium]
MNVWGNRVKLSIFGESHGKSVGIVIDGLPPGEAVDLGEVAREMRRRAPGRNALSSGRQEEDSVEILSGLYKGRTTGFPVCGVIYNKDARSRDYDSKLRPGHADWTALLKYGGHADMRGGGHFSGRLTAPLCFAGSLAKQILSRRGIKAYARVDVIGRVIEPEVPVSSEEYRAVSFREFPSSPSAEEAMKAEIEKALKEGDSVGGVVAAAAFGLPGGLGEPFFGSMESAIASLLFSIPAVKGVEFGDGFRLALMRGSEANDALYIGNPENPENGSIRARTNHNGGILGGITNGMPLLVRAAIKPTPSISRPQETVDGETKRETILRVSGRHDPCVVPRAVPVVESCLAFCVLDGLMTCGAPL